MSAEQAYLFRHAVLRDAAYQLQLPADRAKLHALALEIIESSCDESQLDSMAEELALHAKRGADEAAGELLEKQRTYLARAAKAAELRFQMSKAASLFEELALLWEGGNERRLRALHGAGRAYHRLGQFSTSQLVYSKAMQECTGAPIALQLGIESELLALDQICARHQEVLAKAPPLIERATAARETQTALRVRYMLALAKISTSQEERPAEELESIANDAEAAKDVQLAVTVRSVYGIVLRHMAKLAESEAVLRRCIEDAQAAGLLHTRAVALGYLAHTLSTSGRRQDALLAYDESLTFLRQMGDARFIGNFACSRGNTLMHMGRLEEALAEYVVGEACLRDCGVFEDLAAVLLGRASLECERGNEPGWRTALAESLAIASKLNNQSLVHDARQRQENLEARSKKLRGGSP